MFYSSGNSTITIDHNYRPLSNMMTINVKCMQYTRYFSCAIVSDLCIKWRYINSSVQARVNYNIHNSVYCKGTLQNISPVRVVISQTKTTWSIQAMFSYTEIYIILLMLFWKSQFCSVCYQLSILNISVLYLKSDIPRNIQNLSYCSCKTS